MASSHVEYVHPCFVKKARLELIKIARFERRRLSVWIFDGWSGSREYESGRWIGSQGDMRRFGQNVAKPNVIRIPSPVPSRHFLLNVLAAGVKIDGASASLIIDVFKAVFAHTE